MCGGGGTLRAMAVWMAAWQDVGMYRIFVVSLPESPKRKKMAERLSAQGLAWEWVDGVKIDFLEEISAWEREGLEAYAIPRLKEDATYVCRAVGCKRAMQRALARAGECGEEWAVVFQDDARPVSGFPERLERLLGSAPPDAGVVLLYREGGDGPREGDFIRMTADVRCMTAFAVRPAFAQMMAQELASWGREDDLLWLELIQRGEIILCAEPYLAHASHAGSEITGGIPELEMWWKER